MVKGLLDYYETKAESLFPFKHISLKLLAILFLRKNCLSCVEIILFLFMSESLSCSFSLFDSFTSHFMFPSLSWHWLF